MTTPLSFDAAGATDLGTVRTNNEDAALLGAHLVALADGMGGHAAGEVASAVVIDRLDALAHPPADLTRETVVRAVTQAKARLRSLSAADPSMAGMGTTLVALAVTPDGVVLAHVGDSRLYRLRAERLEQLTVDHTHVQRLVDAGRLAPEAVREHPFRSIILRSLDDASDDLPDVTLTEEIEVGDRLLLCSDGLSDYVLDDQIAAALAGGPPQEAATRLVELALAEATRDNVTVVVADVVAGEPDDDAGLHELGASLAAADLSPQAREALDAEIAAEAAQDRADDEHDGDEPRADDEGQSADDEPDGTGEGQADVDDAGGADDDVLAGTAADDDDDEAPATADAVDPDEPADRTATPAAGRADGLWLGLVVLTFLLTTGAVWLTQY